MKLTLSVRSFHTPDTPRDLGLAAEPALGADLAGDPGDLVGERGQLVDHGVDGGLQLEDLAAGVDVDLLGQVAVGDRGGDLGDVADLAGEVVGHDVDVVGEVLPDPGHAADVGLAAEPALGADLAGYPGDLVGEGGQLVDQHVHGLLELQHLARGLDRHLPGEVAAGHRRGDQRDVAHLGGASARPRRSAEASWPPTSSTSCGDLGEQQGRSAGAADARVVGGLRARAEVAARATRQAARRIGSRSASVVPGAGRLAEPLPPDRGCRSRPPPLPPARVRRRRRYQPCLVCLMTRELAVVSVIACPLLRPWPTCPAWPLRDWTALPRCANVTSLPR